MNEQEKESVKLGVLFGAQLVTDKLTTDELVVLVNVATNRGNLRSLKFYEKIKGLLTEDDGTMHKETVEAVITLAGIRLRGS
jgi:hypothetical protein